MKKDKKKKRKKRGIKKGRCNKSGIPDTHCCANRLSAIPDANHVMHVKPPDHSVTEPSPNADIPTLIGMPLIFFFLLRRELAECFFFFLKGCMMQVLSRPKKKSPYDSHPPRYRTFRAIFTACARCLFWQSSNERTKRNKRKKNKKQHNVHHILLQRLGST